MRTPARSLAFAAALSLLGCASAPATTALDGHKLTFPDPKRPSFEPEVVWSPRHVSPRQPMRHEARPTVLAMRSVDYASLDVQGPDPKRADTVGFKVGLVAGAEVLFSKDDVLLEVEAREMRAFWAPKSASSLAFVPSHDRLLATSTDPVEGLPASPLCSQFSAMTVRARGFRRSTWDDDSLELMELYGKVDPRTCQGQAWASEWATASALVDGRLYAFRRCTSRCDGADPRRREELVLIGPPARWSATSAGLEEQARPHAGAFSLITIPVSRGSSASAVLHVEARALAYFLALRGAEPSWAHGERSSLAIGEALAYSVEIAWPEGAETPEAMLYVSKATPMAAELLGE